MSQRTLFALFNEHLQAVDGELSGSISWTQETTDQIDQETCDEKLESLPPRWMSGHVFAFGEGSGSFSIFWQHVGQNGRRFYRDSILTVNRPVNDTHG